MTMIMPMCPNGADVSCEHHAQSCSTFAEDMKKVAAQVRVIAGEVWNEILEINEKLVPGSYGANKLKKDKPECGNIIYRDRDTLTVESGCFMLQFKKRDVFHTLSNIEKTIKCAKMQFVVPGEVAKKG